MQFCGRGFLLRSRYNAVTITRKQLKNRAKTKLTTKNEGAGLGSGAL